MSAPDLLNTARTSDSPWIDSVWTSRSGDVSTMTSVANETWGLAFWQQEGRSHAALVGPENQSSTAPVPAHADFLGIQFAVGTVLRMVPTLKLVNGGIELPETAERSFRLDGARLEIPSIDDAEALVARLVRLGLIDRDPIVAASIDRIATTSSTRTVERRFRSATGLTRTTISQIRRARFAAESLSAGADVGAVVDSCGYCDEPHLARALRRFVGRTAGQLRREVGGPIALTTTGQNQQSRHEATVNAPRRRSA